MPALVLLVEDDADVRAALTEMLRDSGYQVLPAVTAADAAKRLRAIKPTVILTDLLMPGRDGVEFLADFRRSYPQEHQIPALLISAATPELIARRMDESGVRVEVVAKPLDTGALLRKLGELCAPATPGETPPAV